VTFNGADKSSALNTSLEGSPSVVGIGGSSGPQSWVAESDDSGDEAGNRKPMSIALQSFGGIS
jgi:hypothetical protein